MNIGIIGSGEMGTCLASKFIKLGHAVSIANSRGPGSLKQVVGETGIDSLWVQEQLGFPVVKVFNSILATSLKEAGRPKGEKDRIALAVSGDHKKAKEVVFTLVNDLGFDYFDIGTIAQSWKQQPGTSIYCRDLPLNELKKRADAMGTAWSAMHDIIIGKRKKDEALMKADYPAYLQGLQH